MTLNSKRMISRKTFHISLLAAIGIMISALGVSLRANEPIRLKYNHPGLLTDLGVGLWAWPFPVDYDHDGDYDLVVNCPDVPYNGIWYFENTGGKANPVFKAPVWLAPALKNIQFSEANGKLVVMTPGVVYTDFLKSFTQSTDTIFKPAFYKELSEKSRFNLWRMVDYEGDGDQDFIVAIDDWSDYGWDNAFDEKGTWKNGPIHGYIYLVEQTAPDEYAPPRHLNAGGKKIDLYGVSGANFFDFDNDGDLDIIMGEFVDRITWFENIGSRTQPVYAEGKFLKVEGKTFRVDLEMFISNAADWDHDGYIDLIIGEEDGRVFWLRNSGKKTPDGPVFEKPVYFQQEAGDLKFGALVTPYSIDWDNDGDEDLICGNTAGYIGFIENLDGGNPPQWANPVYLKADGKTIRIMAGENGSIQGPAEKKWGYTTLSVVDWNCDGLPDIVANSIWGKIEWYENKGTRSKPRLAAAQPVEVEWSGVNPKPAWNWWNPTGKNLVTLWRTTPLVYDWNQDGLPDLVMPDHEGYLAFWERIREKKTLKLLPGKRIFTAEENTSPTDQFTNDDEGRLRLSTKTAGGSGRRNYCIADWDGDGLPDLLVNSVNISFLKNKGVRNGKVVLENKGPLLTKKMAGHSTSPTVVDWDRDGIPDLLFGAEDGHLYYYPNDQVKKK